MDSERGSEMAKSGSISLKADETVVDLTSQVHQLPCCIKHTGPSSVSHYFKPKSTGVKIDGLKVEEAYFRGRKLQGATIPLPEGYSVPVDLGMEMTLFGVSAPKGKVAWPELVGLGAEDAEKKIKEEKQIARVQVVPPDRFVTMDFNLGRVRLYINSSGKVARPPPNWLKLLLVENKHFFVLKLTTLERRLCVRWL